jgi:hypothetical protein
MAAPVIDHVLTMPIFSRQALTLAEVVIGTRSTILTVHIAVALSLIAVIAVSAALALFVAAAIIAIAIPLAKGDAAVGQGHRHKDGYDCFAFHRDLLLMVPCRFSHRLAVIRHCQTAR